MRKFVAFYAQNGWPFQFAGAIIWAAIAYAAWGFKPVISFTAWLFLPTLAWLLGLWYRWKDANRPGAEVGASKVRF